MVFIPRAIWPGKPRGTTDIVSDAWHETSIWSSNVVPLPFGELYMNGGLLPVVVGLFLAGMIVRGFNVYMIENWHNPIIFMAYAFILPDFISQWRGALNAMTVMPLFRVAIFLSLFWVIGKLVPVHNQPQLQQVDYHYGDDWNSPAQSAVPVDAGQGSDVRGA